MTITQGEVSLTSVYVPARDGTRLAVDTWLPATLPDNARLPTVFTLTRYWRSLGFKQETLAWQKSYEDAVLLANRGFALVVADARGSGASFGTRESEFSQPEVDDIADLIEWIACQQWSNGSVASSGISYSANAAFLSAIERPPALIATAPLAADFDVYAQLLRPGGLESFFIHDWGRGVWALDQNDIDTLVKNMKTPAPAPVVLNVTGVRPVDEDSNDSLLADAVREHAGNFNVVTVADQLRFRNQDEQSEILLARSSVFTHRESIEESGIPIHYRTGWLDAGTQLGALSLFNTFSNPMRVSIGPWNHGFTSVADPFDTDEPRALSPQQKIDLILSSLDGYDRNDGDAPCTEPRILDYYTFGENVWKSTRTWPLPDTRITRFYLAGDRALQEAIPGTSDGEDLYVVDPEASTGPTNRWHTNEGGGPVWYPDRREEDKKLLVYETQPLPKDLEVTGHPLLRLFVASSVEDCDFLFYLEDVSPDGAVHYVTEGCLRSGNRKISTDPPYAFVGPYHSCLMEDFAPLRPDEIAEIKTGLFPTSALFRKGHRVRLAISGADKGTFLPMDNIGDTRWRVQHNSKYPSYLELPTIPR